MPYRLHPSEPDAYGITRAAREQVAKAIDALAQGGDDADAIHTARKALKKARSALRLLRHTLPELYERENDALRDAGRTLSPLRDQQVLLQTLDDHFADTPGHAEARQALLDQTHPALRDDDAATHDAVPEALVQLRRCLDRLETPPDAAEQGAAAQGWRQTLRRVRKARKKAEQSRGVEDLHTLRKRMKDFDHQARLLGPRKQSLGIPRLKPARRLAGRINDRLGEHHDLSLLREALGESDPNHASLRQAIDHRRETLTDKALRKTKRLLKMVRG